MLFGLWCWLPPIKDRTMYTSSEAGRALKKRGLDTFAISQKKERTNIRDEAGLGHCVAERANEVADVDDALNEAATNNDLEGNDPNESVFLDRE